MEHQPLKIENKEYFKEEWLQAFLEGVSLIPQHGDGIRLKLAISLLVHDSEQDWHRFINSTLSEKQVQYLLQKATSQHNSTNIGTNSLSVDKVRGLWMSYRDSTLDMFADYIFLADTNLLKHPDNEEREKVIIGFFSNPTNKKKVEELKEMLMAVERSLKGENVLGLLKQYKIAVKTNFQSTGKGTSELWLRNYRSRFKSMLESEIKAAFGGQVPEITESLFAELT